MQTDVVALLFIMWEHYVRKESLRINMEGLYWYALSLLLARLVQSIQAFVLISFILVMVVYFTTP